MKQCEAGFWRHEPVADQSALGLAQATLRFHEAVGGDWVKLTPAGTFQATALGLIDEWAGDALGRRRIVHRPLNTAADWSALTTRAGVVGLGEQEWANARAVAWLKQRLPQHLPLMATVFSTLTQAVQLAGVEGVAACALADPGALEACLLALGRRNLALVQALGEAGVDGVYYVSQHHSRQFWPQDMSHWQGWHLDALAMAACPDRGWNVLHFHGHCDGVRLPEVPNAWTVHGEGGAVHASESAACPGPGAGWLTLDADVLASATDIPSRHALLQQAMASRAGRRWRVTANCVLPQGFDLTQARRWVQTVHAWPCAPGPEASA